LSDRSRRVWDKICRVEKDPNRVKKIEMLFDRYGEGMRTTSFLHALVNSHYNPSQACRKVHVPYRTFTKWVENDFQFARMVDEIETHKKNHGEAALWELVDQREPKAVLFFNRTRNRDRGYSEKIEVEHSGTVKSHTILELDEKLLDRLSVAARKEILQVAEEVQEEQEQIEMGNGKQLLIPNKEEK
jgi:hypothetical protein